MLREIALSYPYLRTRRLLRKTEFWTSEKLKNLQEKFLRKVLKFAAANVPFYRDRIGYNYIRSEVDPYELIKKFPIIDKEVIRQNLPKFFFGSKIRRLKAITGGSTNQPLLFYMDRFATRQMEKAFIFDLWGRVGYTFGDSIFTLRARMPKKGFFISHDRFFNIYYASSIDLNRSSLSNYVNYLNNLRPLFLHGYPSTIYQLVNLIESSKVRLEFKPRAVLCGSEKLFDYHRNKIEAMFDCKVFSWYGQSEYLALGGECEYSHFYHFYPQYGYLELFPTGIKNDAGKEIFEIVATGFNNPVMPIIRYRTGDYAVPANTTQCKCGRNYLFIEDVIGREQEFVVDANGSLISANCLVYETYFDNFTGLESVQIRQNTPGVMEVVLVRGPHYCDESFLQTKDSLNSLLGERMRIHFIFTDQIPKTPIGKAKFVIQELDIGKYLHH